MSKLTKENVLQMAAQAGLDVDDRRAETIASRLGAVLEELDDIPGEALEGLEPALTFTVEEQSHD